MLLFLHIKLKKIDENPINKKKIARSSMISSRFLGSTRGKSKQVQSHRRQNDNVRKRNYREEIEARETEEQID